MAAGRLIMAIGPFGCNLLIVCYSFQAKRAACGLLFLFTDDTERRIFTMPSNVQDLAQMADHAATQITDSHTDWTDVLKTAARLYKYPYRE